MASLITLRQRIKSIKNTRQITQAMEKVSAVKMRRAQAAALKSRRYAALADEMVAALGVNAEKDTHAFLRVPERITRPAYLVFSSERGLCGSLNMRLVQQLLRSIETRGGAESVSIYGAGRKVLSLAARARIPIKADFGGVPAVPSLPDARAIARLVATHYLNGEIDAVFLIFAKFRDTMTQTPVVQQLLPMIRPEKSGDAVREMRPDYRFEPSPREVLDNLLWRILELQIYQAMVEHNASEHSARMVAMKNATDNIEDLLDTLTLAFNQTRQTGITREIAEISAGKAALEI